MRFSAQNLQEVLTSFGMAPRTGTDLTSYFEGGFFNRESFNTANAALDEAGKREAGHLGDALDFAFGRNSKDYTSEAIQNAGRAYQRNGQVGLGNFALPTHSSSQLMNLMETNAAAAAFGGAAIGGIVGAAMGNDAGESAVFGGVAGAAMFGMGRGLRSGAFMEQIERRAISSVLGKSHDELVAGRQAVYRGRLEGEVERNREIVQQETQKSMNNEEMERLVREQGTPEQRMLRQREALEQEARTANQEQFVGIDRRTNQPVTKQQLDSMPDEEASNIYKVELNKELQRDQYSPVELEGDNNWKAKQTPEEELRKQYLSERQLSENLSESEKDTIQRVRQSLRPEDLARFDEEVYQNTEKQLNRGATPQDPIESLQNADGSFSFNSLDLAKEAKDRTLRNQLNEIDESSFFPEPIEPKNRSMENIDKDTGDVFKSDKSTSQLLDSIDETIANLQGQPFSINKPVEEPILSDDIVRNTNEYQDLVDKTASEGIDNSSRPHTIEADTYDKQAEMDFSDSTIVDLNTPSNPDTDRAILRRQAALNFKPQSYEEYTRNMSAEELNAFEKQLADEQFAAHSEKVQAAGYDKSKVPELKQFNAKEAFGTPINPRQALNEIYNSEFDNIVESQKRAAQKQKELDDFDSSHVMTDSKDQTNGKLNELKGDYASDVKMDYEKTETNLYSGTSLNRLGPNATDQQVAAVRAEHENMSAHFQANRTAGEDYYSSNPVQYRRLKDSYDIQATEELFPFNEIRQSTRTVNGGAEGPPETKTLNFRRKGSSEALKENEELIDVQGSNYNLVGEKTDPMKAVNASKQMLKVQDLLSEGRFDNMSRPLANKELLQEAVATPTTSFMGKQAQKLLRSGPDHNVGMQTRHMVLGGSMLAGAAFGSKRKDHSRGFNSHRGNRI